MRTSLNDLAMTLDQPEVTLHEGDGTDWGGKHIGVEAYHTEFDMAPLLKGLPHDACSSRHWGIVLAGEVHVTYTDGSSEILRANDVYYLPPGHSIVLKAGTKIVEWSEAEEYAAVMEVALQNFEALQAQ